MAKPFDPTSSICNVEVYWEDLNHTQVIPWMLNRGIRVSKIPNADESYGVVEWSVVQGNEMDWI